MPAEPTAPASSRMERGYARGRARDDELREGLEPLEPGERPGAVTAAIIVAVVFALGNDAIALSGHGLSGGDTASATQFSVIWTIVLLGAAAGMWAARYWAVLGFQCILGLQIMLFTLALLRVEKWWLGVGLVVFIGAMGYLFWKLVRAMARLQMPERPQSRA